MVANVQCGHKDCWSKYLTIQTLSVLKISSGDSEVDVVRYPRTRDQADC